MGNISTKFEVSTTFPSGIGALMGQMDTSAIHRDATEKQQLLNSCCSVHFLCNTGSHIRCGQQWSWESNRSSWRTVQNGLLLLSCIFPFWSISWYSFHYFSDI